MKKPKMKASHKILPSVVGGGGGGGRMQISDVSIKKESESAKHVSATLPECMCNRSLSEFQVPGPIPDFYTQFLDEGSVSNFFKALPVGCEYCCNN